MAACPMIGWGILGTGGVANAFADALREVSGAELHAVGSRTFDKALHFADRHNVGSPFGSAEEMVACDDVDVIYVASPASHHYRHTMLALQAGKHVLVEKPFAVNAAQASAMQAEAKGRGLFLMEAMWCRFLPAYVKLRRLVADGAVGEVRSVEASFGGRATVNPKSRPFRLDLAGGALMDGAVYPIHLAHTTLGGAPELVFAGASFGVTGVDEQTAVAMIWPGGQLASALGAITTTFSATATVYGTDGMIVLPGNMTNPSWIEVHRPGQPAEHYDFASDWHRLAWQAAEVHRCLASGLIESPVMPVVDSVGVMRTLDRAREQIGLRFPDDVEAT